MSKYFTLDFRFWEIEMYMEVHWKYNITVYCIMPTELRSNEYYVTLYIHWMYFFVYYLFPFIALVIFNMAIYLRVSNISIYRVTKSKLEYLAKSNILPQ